MPFRCCRARQPVATTYAFSLRFFADAACHAVYAADIFYAIMRRLAAMFTLRRHMAMAPRHVFAATPYHAMLTRRCFRYISWQMMFHAAAYFLRAADDACCRCRHVYILPFRCRLAFAFATLMPLAGLRRRYFRYATLYAAYARRAATLCFHTRHITPCLRRLQCQHIHDTACHGATCHVAAIDVFSCLMFRCCSPLRCCY